MMDKLVDAIRDAVVSDATDEARMAGAQACRTILTALEARAGEPLAAPTTATSPLHIALSAVRGMPPEQLLDLAIARLRAALPAGTDASTVQPLKFHILPLPSIGGHS